MRITVNSRSSDPPPSYNFPLQNHKMVTVKKLSDALVEPYATDMLSHANGYISAVGTISKWCECLPEQPT